ncbi:hypothetical protein [Kitasatospora sp. P5_F3]
MSTTAPAPVAPLTMQEAEIPITAAGRAAVAAGVTAGVTVLDAGGHLLAVHRDDRLIGAIGGGGPEQDHGFATTTLAELAR